MRKPSEFWHEMPMDREERLARQTEDRAHATNDHMELVYSDDLDELFAEVLRLDELVGDGRAQGILRRLLPERMAAYENMPD